MNFAINLFKNITWYFFYFNGEKYEFLGSVPKSKNKNYDIDYSPETENDMKLKKNDSKKSNLCINTKLDKTQTKNKKR